LTALRFYDAINAGIATGDLAPLTALVAPALLSDPAEPDPAPAGLARRLRALHAIAPSLRLRVTDLAVDSDLVLARVETLGDVPATFLGLRLRESTAAWGPVDVLRLADGRVVAYKRGAIDGVLLEPTLALPWPLLGAEPHALIARRIDLTTRAVHRAVPVDASRLLVVVTGAVSVEVTEPTDAPAFAVSRQVGEHRTIPVHAAYAVTAIGEDPATLLELTVVSASDVLPTGLMVGEARDVVAESVVLALGWATLPPDARLAWDANGPVLLHVAAGAVRLDAPGGKASAVGAAGDATLGDAGPLAAGDEITLLAGVATLRAGTVPTTILLVTLLPTGGPASDADATPRAVGGP
jgi:hypothetical protein